jgi:hypothetical protein
LPGRRENILRASGKIPIIPSGPSVVKIGIARWQSWKPGFKGFNSSRRSTVEHLEPLGSDRRLGLLRMGPASGPRL